MTYLYVETEGQTGMFDRAPSANSWTDEGEWEELRTGALRIFRIEGETCEEMKPDGTWEPVKGWYRT